MAASDRQLKEQNLTPEKKHIRREQVLTQGLASVTRSIADAVVVKNENMYFLTRPDGSVPLDGNHGFGLYGQDCRYLNGYVLEIGRQKPNVLVADDEAGFAAVFELANPEISAENGGTIPMDEVGIRWERVLDAGRNTLFDEITLRNYSRESLEFSLSLEFRAGFEDVFNIRGLVPERMGAVQPPAWKDGSLVFIYRGADQRCRGLAVHFSPRPQRAADTTAEYVIELRPGESKKLLVSLLVSEAPDEARLQLSDPGRVAPIGVRSYFHEISEQWVKDQTEIQSDSLLLDQIMDRSLHDLRMLQTSLQGRQYFAAGVPWFVTLFGRDSLITALQMLAFNPAVAEDTLRLLAEYQAQEIDEWRDAQPGKILHELRTGELARLGEIPHSPYYGTVDATPLFLILLALHAGWTGRLDLFQELRPNVERALNWIDQYGDTDGDGYVDYRSETRRGLVNQGWKDAGNSIISEDGRLGEPPIALVEVQAYVYQAKHSLAGLYERQVDGQRAAALRREAQELRHRFNRDFWSEELGTYILAFEDGGKPVQVVTSNPGHALWSGIADEEKARRTSERLMAEDMFSGWGIRTLSSDSRAYNPIGYHLGTVWPHDSALVAAGFRRYGFYDAACRIFDGLSQAAMRFHAYRLPELFSGFSRSDYSIPVHYPVACHPQAWAAASLPYLLTVLLGLQPQAFDRRLHIVRPVLPDFVDWLQVRRLRVGDARVDLKFERSSGAGVAVQVLAVEGELDVVTETGG